MRSADSGEKGLAAPARQKLQPLQHPWALIAMHSTIARFMLI